jgi:tRNA (guanine37-N1)-methyltransferase
MLVSFLLSAAFFAPAGFAASAPRAVEVEEKVVEPELEDAASVGESEDAREMLRKNMQDLAQSHLDHAILEAQLEKLAEVYDSRGNDQRVREVLDCPHYTRPETVEGLPVPAELLTGDHAAVRRWRLKQALGRTWLRRPDLLARRRLSAEEEALLAEFRAEIESAAALRGGILRGS